MSTDHRSRCQNSQLTVGIVVNDVKALLVVHGSEVGLGDGKANSVCETLTERAGGDINA